MTVLLYADECVDARVVLGLRAGGLDIVTAKELGLLGASDVVHLNKALKLGRIVVSADQDFLSLAHHKLQNGEQFPGLFFLTPEIKVGRAVRELFRLAEQAELGAIRFVR